MTHNGLRSLNKLDMLQMKKNAKAIAKHASNKNGPKTENDRPSSAIIYGSEMNIVFVGAEVGPWRKTGGLGDVLGGLPPTMAGNGHRVMTVSPCYDQSVLHAADKKDVVGLMQNSTRRLLKSSVTKVLVEASSLELLATFCDSILKKDGSEKLSDEAIEKTIKKVEVNPVWQQKKLREFFQKKGIHVTAYSPLGGRGTRWGTNRVMDCETLKEIADAKGKTVAQVHFPGAYFGAIFFSSSRTLLLYARFTSLLVLFWCSFYYLSTGVNYLGPPRKDHGSCAPAFCRIIISMGAVTEGSGLKENDLELAKTLVRPNGMFFTDVAKESLLTDARYESVSRVCIVCEEDQLMKPEFQRWIIQNSPPDEVKSIANADHMIILSKPKELCLCLQEISQKYH
ncbi:hypothetical protein LOK49_LG03G01198 [Camellia lanceoleosa]|uniref:Uncharacterized protein n=1 Tax=Camellia lanceoleosa TaxID=1840588 RepID=A0ACC0IBF5_9ERIC|nr:hypothetical protein LOK49_LG03G01198 [Camellia lanceoleosa]